MSCPDPDTQQSLIWNRALLRNVLALYLDASPTDLVLFDGENGKPYLAHEQADQGLHFNLSHSSSWLLMGCTRRTPLGVDVEVEREGRDLLRLARRFFNKSELDYLAELPLDQLDAAFFGIWTAKEALLKVVGHGFGMASQTFETKPVVTERVTGIQFPSSVSAPEPLVVERVHDPKQGSPSEWAGLRFRVERNHHACVAMRQPGLRICFPQLDSKWISDNFPLNRGSEC